MKKREGKMLREEEREYQWASSKSGGKGEMGHSLSHQISKTQNIVKERVMKQGGEEIIRGRGYTKGHTRWGEN